VQPSTPTGDSEREESFKLPSVSGNTFRSNSHFARRTSNSSAQKITETHRSNSTANLIASKPSREYLNSLSTGQRAWLLKRKMPVDFTVDEIKRLRTYFEQLDTDKTGEIGVLELEKPLISMNLCHNRAEVTKILK